MNFNISDMAAAPHDTLGLIIIQYNTVAKDLVTCVPSDIDVELLFDASGLENLLLKKMADHADSLIAGKVEKLAENYFACEMDYAGRVKKYRYLLGKSKLINECCGYIVANINRTIRLPELAQSTGLKPDSLAQYSKIAFLDSLKS